MNQGRIIAPYIGTNRRSGATVATMRAAAGQPRREQRPKKQQTPIVIDPADVEQLRRLAAPALERFAQLGADIPVIGLCLGDCP